ncbi:TetR/AcrR family transcriptional regulator [Sphingomonas bacterium]|uniref:TetR/AcrR family transcriptional regulator n=1 Tax=Sphingomonas bacterium TaxID=1895847 RepID=UPI001576D804|nr:TetR/AcrR family transcriptional regulator [Sphingomonas bacterium]
MADHVLNEGLSAATLRPLAVAAGTSDRMLLYYFADKDELLAATLERVAARMIAALDDVIPPAPPQSFAALLDQAWTALASDKLRPFMPLWLDLAAGAARGLQPHRDIVGRIADGFLSWVTIRLLPEEDGRPSTGPLFMAVIEGSYLLSALGRSSIGDAAIGLATTA